MAPIQPKNRMLARSHHGSSRQHPTPPASKESAFGVLKSLFAGNGKGSFQAKSPSRDGVPASFELVPKARAGSNTVDEDPPSSFPTEFGLRRVPRRRHPLRPSPHMIRDARQGILSKFLRTGEFLPASDFGDMVDPQTARLELNEEYYFETMHISNEEEDMGDDQKTTANLFYIAVNDDELPSYHFWQAEGDVNPMKAPMYFDWGDYFSKTNPDARFETFENDVLRQRREQNAAQDHAATGADENVIQNAWMPGGENYHQFNPKRGVRASTVEALEPAWEPRGTIAGTPYNSSSQGTVDDSRHNGPQPGDEEWETIEADFEEQLTQKGFRQFMVDYKRQSPERYEAMKYGPKSPMVRPVFGDDPDTKLFNDVLKTSVPTVAFKLTQQHFERPVSPINEQEPLVRGRDPKHWARDPNSMEDGEKIYGGLVMHEEGELEFLDFYNEKAYGKIMIRSRRPIPEEYIHREEPYRARVLEDLEDDQPRTVEAPTDLGQGLQNAFALFEDPFGEASKAAGKPSARTTETTSGPPMKAASKFTQSKTSRKKPLQVQGDAPGDSKKDKGSRNQVSVAENDTEAANRSFTLVRPSQRAPQNWVQIQPPATVHDGHEIFEAAARLYPKINLENIGIRLTSQEEFQNGDITPAIIEELAIDSIRWHELVNNIFPSTKIVIVVPAYEEIEIRDGTNTAPIDKPVNWVIGGNRNPALVMAHFQGICENLLGQDNVSGPFAPGVAIRVSEYQQEWLRWTRTTSERDFVRDVFYKIDHPGINIYPVGWKSQTTFDRAEQLRKQLMAEQQKKSGKSAQEVADELRKKLLAEQQTKTGEGAGKGAEKGAEEPAGPPGEFELDSEIQAEHEKHFQQKLRDLQAKTQARIEPETVYGGLDDDIVLPRWGPSREHQIRGGSDFPSLITRVPTVSEIEQEQRYRNMIENELLQREEFCRVCRQTFRHGDTSAINNHYRQHEHAETWLCPFCSRNFTEYTTEARTEHIATAHPTVVPQPLHEDCPWSDCLEDLAQGDQYPDMEAVMQHMRAHYEDDVEWMRNQRCPMVPCRAGMAFMSDLEREEHEEWHQVMGDLSESSEDEDHGNGGSGQGGPKGKGPKDKGSKDKGPKDNGPKDKDVSDGGSKGGTPPREHSPPPGPKDLGEEPKDPQSQEEQKQPQEPKDLPKQLELSESEIADLQSPNPQDQPTKTADTGTGRPRVQCCAVCFTQLRSLTGVKRDRHFQRCGNVARTTIDLTPTEARQRKAQYEKRQKARPKDGAAGHQNRKVKWDENIYNELSALAVGHERKRKRMALVEVPQRSPKQSRQW